MDELLTAEQVAASWGVSPSLLRQPTWRQRHGLVAIRVGRLLRFSPAQVTDFVQRHAEGRGAFERKDSTVATA